MRQTTYSLLKSAWQPLKCYICFLPFIGTVSATHFSSASRKDNHKFEWTVTFPPLVKCNKSPRVCHILLIAAAEPVPGDTVRKYSSWYRIISMGIWCSSYPQRWFGKGLKEPRDQGGKDNYGERSMNYLCLLFEGVTYWVWYVSAVMLVCKAPQFQCFSGDSSFLHGAFWNSASSVWLSSRKPWLSPDAATVGCWWSCGDKRWHEIYGPRSGSLATPIRMLHFFEDHVSSHECCGCVNVSIYF